MAVEWWVPLFTSNENTEFFFYYVNNFVKARPWAFCRNQWQVIYEKDNDTWDMIVALIKGGHTSKDDDMALGH